MNSYNGIRHLPWDEFMVYGVNRLLVSPHREVIVEILLNHVRKKIGYF